MPYRTLHDLPDRVKSNLPQHAQEIYQKAFNHAWEQYRDPESRYNDEATREETAHKVAWSAVKKDYRKEGEHWVRRR